ncbi:MAG: hypothetical protein ACRDTA_13080 [Pseudonocardiaceae bacterium]
MTGTGSPACPGDPPERSTARAPEWSLELLADLHAGVLTDRAAARLRPRVAADPQASTVFMALDATVADLATLQTRCPARMPDAVAQRLDAALATEALATEALATGALEPDRHYPYSAAATRFGYRRAARRELVIKSIGWRRRRAGWIGAGVLAAAVMVATMAGVMTSVLTGGAPRAGDALGAAAVSPPAPLALSGDDVGGALNQVLGARDYGPLSRPEALRRCLDAHDVPVRDKPLGGREVTLDGRPGVILVLPTTRVDEFRLLVVGPACGPANPARIADGVAGRR